MTTTQQTTVTYSLEDILARIENKIDTRFEKVDRQLTEVNQRLTKLEIGQAELSGEIKALDERLSGEIKALDEKLSGEIKALDERLSGEVKAMDERLSGNIKTLSEKVDGLGKRLDNQEFLNRGVVVAVLAALIAGGAKLLGVLPKG
jgi:chromosome segregation ATPase